MMGHTNRHGRFFLRLMSPHVRLYTEMTVARAVLYGDKKHLKFSQKEHPVCLQLAGNNPAQLGEAARIGEDFGYQEINLNVGCPSRTVQRCGWGAVLMQNPGRVADCVAAMCAATRIPISVKCRLGVDEQDEGAVFDFVDTVAQAGCRVFFVHARKAFLTGINPKKNRTVPTLNYSVVYALKKARPALTIVLNGGVRTPQDCLFHLGHVDGVMVGRAAYKNPWMIAAAAQKIFKTKTVPSQKNIFLQLSEYVAQGAPLAVVCRHIMGLFYAQPRARAVRHLLSQAPKDVFRQLEKVGGVYF